MLTCSVWQCARYVPRPPPMPRSAPRFVPFLSGRLDDYLQRYWAVVFTVGARALQTGHMRHYLAWYCTRLKVVELDHHVYADALRQQLLARSGTSELPLLFVHERLVGTLARVQSLEERRLLKDVVQFGFEWKGGVGGTGAPQALHVLPSAYGDAAFFRGRYRGTPVTRPVTQLPRLHPYHHDEDA